MDKSTMAHNYPPRQAMRHWFSIELSAYVVLCLVLVTEAWAHSHASGMAVLVLWTFVGSGLVLWVRGLCRRLSQRPPQTRGDGSK
jgi:hypothetical protein